MISTAWRQHVWPTGNNSRLLVNILAGGWWETCWILHTRLSIIIVSICLRQYRPGGLFAPKSNSSQKLIPQQQAVRAQRLSVSVSNLHKKASVIKSLSLSGFAKAIVKLSSEPCTSWHFSDVWLFTFLYFRQDVLTFLTF